jgi:C4-type Zn-finger protein
MEGTAEPTVCPKCDSDNITSEGFEQEVQEVVHRKVICEECGFRWREYFHFESWEEE